MFLSKCTIRGSKKSGFIKKQEESGILSSLGLKTPLNKIQLFGKIFLNAIPMNHYKVNKIVNTFLLAGDTFMREIHLKCLQNIYWNKRKN